MAGKKEKIEQVMGRQELIERINLIKTPMNKALISFLYLSGCRISEVVGTKKVIKKYKKEGKVKTLIDTIHIEVPPIYKEDIEYIPEQEMLLVTNAPCLKRRDGVPRRIIPIKYTKEPELFNNFIAYYNSLPVLEPLFSITRQRAWQIVKKELKQFNHYLTHSRCTHLVTRNNFTDADLKQFRGWASTAPATIYTHLRWQDIAKKM